ncbi:MAG: DUF839 domain-containing protein [Sphingobacteriaceae bacterium]|nr:DUF839 domain-containing protein [Sphingobacteriaceae bacterium]
MSVSRRTFIKNTALVSLGFIGLNRFVANAGFLGTDGNFEDGFGPLFHQPGDILSLPKGFSARVISRRGDKMDDGFIVPGMYDGMGAFSTHDNKILLVRNHEIAHLQKNVSPFDEHNLFLSGTKPEQFYDFANGQPCMGGTSTLLYNEFTGNVELQYLSLCGTIRNCAGGITPWNSWITCEETSLTKGESNGLLEQSHGYNFEVPATTKIGLTKPIPLKAMGRFVHEAVAVHPTKGIVYQTEDLSDSVFYRFIPNQPGKLHEGGKLQCLVISDWKAADTRNWDENKGLFPQKKVFKAHWIDLDDVEAPDNDLRLRGHQNGAALFARQEGIWFGNNELFFAATSGGRKGLGQIFRYVPSKYEGTPQEKDAPATLELFLEPNNTEIFQSCDNLSISPWGDIIICEDKRNARIIGITPQGKTYTIAKNMGYSNSEFAGPVFSPSGRTLFVNIQSPGLTLAITGPWKR